MSSQDWRTEITATDYLSHRDKRQALEERRPVIRKASDLVGPGIASEAVRITDYNDVLATFNGYFASEPGALYAPNDEDSFIGSVIGDAGLGGKQVFTSLVSGNEYTRVFLRNPSDESSVSWGLWHTDEAVPATAHAPAADSRGFTELLTGVATACEMPEMAFIGDEDTYAKSTTVLSILRTGVYSGYFWWRTTENNYVDVLKIEFPNGLVQTYDIMYNVLGYSGIQVPLHFYAASTDGFVRVTATQTALPAQNAEFYRLHISRLGDAP